MKKSRLQSSKESGPLRRILLPGQHFDVETGLHYNYFRSYDPATWSHLRTSRLRLQVGVNTYRNVGNNPI
ncbi:MAG: hypothetical protein GWN81_07720 [Phycisphaerae bacterium]|nr:hypothetical protein [Phycisphaerae bacterium]NIU08728.1 hypothetical protein [Phycisphaerae bacterium]NIW98329.1 hypothetical protein [Phycisphaerae bacterium]